MCVLNIPSANVILATITVFCKCNLQLPLGCHVSLFSVDLGERVHVMHAMVKNTQAVHATCQEQSKYMYCLIEANDIFLNCGFVHVGESVHVIHAMVNTTS